MVDNTVAFRATENLLILLIKYPVTVLVGPLLSRHVPLSCFVPCFGRRRFGYGDMGCLTKNLSMIIKTERKYYVCSGWHGTETGRFFVPKYAILCNNNANFCGYRVVTQDYAHFWEFRDIA